MAVEFFDVFEAGYPANILDQVDAFLN